MLSDIKRVVGDHDRFFDDEATRSDQRYADVPALHHRALADACSVVNSLDGKCREELIRTEYALQRAQASDRRTPRAETRSEPAKHAAIRLCQARSGAH